MERLSLAWKVVELAVDDDEEKKSGEHVTLSSCQIRKLKEYLM